MIIGIDFDNTIVCYDRIFHRVAFERGLIPEETPLAKNAVRDFLRVAGKEDVWTEMQGYVYGERMRDADAFPGLKDFLRTCADRGIRTCIVSHKTRYPYLGPQYDLHEAARNWIALHELHSLGVRPEDVFFELTKEGKLSRIADLECDLFIDDLPEFLGEPKFPSAVNAVLFDPNGLHGAETRFEILPSWESALSLLEEA